MATALALSGGFQKITLGPTSKVLGAGKFELSGVTRNVANASEFGIDADIFDYVSSDGGTIKITGAIYDPWDESQNALRYYVNNAVKLSNRYANGIRFWLNAKSYLTIGTSGNILMTRAGEVSVDRNGLARTSFEGQVSGAFLYIESDGVTWEDTDDVEWTDTDGVTFEDRI